MRCLATPTARESGGGTAVHLFIAGPFFLSARARSID